MTPSKIFIVIIIASLLGWIIFTILQGQYLEAVAISCIGSVLLWFALGAGRTPQDRAHEQEQHQNDD